MPAADVQRLGGVGRLQHVVAVSLEDFEERPAHVLLVLDEQDRLPGALAGAAVLAGGHPAGILAARQVDDEARPVAGLAVGDDLAE
jgi:hypothetical protein